MTVRAAQPAPAVPQILLRRETRFMRVVLAVLLLAALTVAAMLALGTFAERRPFFAPLSLRSVLAADYSADPFADKVAGFGPDLVADIIRDAVPTDAAVRIATVVSDVQTPVSTIANAGLPVATNTPVPSATIPAVVATQSPTPPGATSIGVPIATETETPDPPSATQAATPRATFTFAPRTPTRTLTPVPTFILVPSSTPTWTAPAPTNTFPPPTDPPPPATNPPPPTDTPPPTEPPPTGYPPPPTDPPPPATSYP